MVTSIARYPKLQQIQPCLEIALSVIRKWASATVSGDLYDDKVGGGAPREPTIRSYIDYRGLVNERDASEIGISTERDVIRLEAAG